MNIIKLLLNHGLRSDDENVISAIAQREDFFKALENNDIKMVEELLKKGAGIFVNAKRYGVPILDAFLVNEEIIALLRPYILARIPTKSAR